MCIRDRLHTVYQSSTEQLLYSVNGEVPKGALCALMGPSGAGKSTLLELLTGRMEPGRCAGEVLFNGRSVVDQRVQLLNWRFVCALSRVESETRKHRLAWYLILALALSNACSKHGGWNHAWGIMGAPPA